MNLVLTMAGKYSRFKLFGNQIPKYLLPLGAETILAEVIKQYLRSTKISKIYLIANRHDQIFFPIVRSIMGKYNINHKHLIYIDDTASQLETALTTHELLPSDQLNLPIAFANIDTVLFNRTSFFESLESGEPKLGFLDTFNGESKQYSYARLDEAFKVIDVVDKSAISQYACSGLYGFGSYSFMAKVASHLLKENGIANFTDLYRKYIFNNENVYAHYTKNSSHTIVLGTPEEYLINIHRFK
jgi:dTDP-glucose pyrophosphorylase